MRLPNMTASGDTLLKEFGLYHKTRLDADASLYDMAKRWDAAQERLRAKVLTYEDAQAKTMTTMAFRDGVEAALGDEIRRLFGTLVHKTHNNIRSPLFGIFFPGGLSAVMKTTLEARLEKVDAILGKLAQQDDPDLAAHAAPLSAAADALVAAIAEHKEVRKGEIRAFGVVEQEKVAWFDHYKLDYLALAQHFFQDPKKADTFFKRIRGAKTKTAPTPLAVAAPSQTATA